MIHARIARRAHNLPNDVDMLQTDIMRFLAIICMCLMILFALVQTLPLAGGNIRPRLQSPDLLAQQSRLLQDALSEARAELRALNDTIARRSHSLAAVQQAEVRLADAERMLSRVEQQLQAAESMLARRLQSLAALENTLQGAQSRLEQAQTAMRQARAHIEPLPAPGADRIEHEPARPSAAAQQGFTLAFAGEEALRRLITDAGTVALFYIAGGKSWRLQAAPGGQWTFIAGAAPPALYEMEEHSVPYAIRDAAKKVAAAYGRPGPFFGVKLPHAIENDIRRLINSRSGGSIVIGAAGEVHIE
jgi:hypothetical protein